MNPRSVSPLSILVITLLLLVIITPVTADGTIPTKTTVYFEQNGRPFDGPVSSPAPAGRSVIDRIACWFADRFSGGCL
jgi:hypothetical protein